MLMPGRKQELKVHCRFAEEGEDLLELICESFRSFLYREITKSANF